MLWFTYFKLVQISKKYTFINQQFCLISYTLRNKPNWFYRNLGTLPRYGFAQTKTRWLESKKEINGTFHFKKNGIMDWMHIKKAKKFQFDNRQLSIYYYQLLSDSLFKVRWPPAIWFWWRIFQNLLIYCLKKVLL